MAARSDREIRADYDRDSIVVYQAYSPAIADAALAAGRFVAPFSFGRMTWIKPSFLWLMERSDWGSKANQERILAVRIGRTAWNQALALAVLTHYEAKIHGDPERWRRDLEGAPVRVQWDPERSIRGAALPVRAIQVGIGRGLAREYAESWVRAIVDLTPLSHKLRRLCTEGRHDQASARLPRERAYSVEDTDVRRRLGMDP